MLHKFNTSVYNYNNNVAMVGTEDAGQTKVAPPGATEPVFIRHGLALNGPEEEVIPEGQSRVVAFDLPGCSVTNSYFLLYLQQFPLELTLELQPDGKKRLRSRTVHQA